MAIPQQLAEQLSDPAGAVQEFCNMAPGIPWTNQILDDMLDTLRKEKLILVQNKIIQPVNGLRLLKAHLMTKEIKVKKTTKQYICATVSYDKQYPYYDMGQIYDKLFDFDRRGLKDAICFMQQTVQNIKRRGVCETCNTGERPKKRLCVADTGLCSSCLIHKVVF